MGVWGADLDTSHWEAFWVAATLVVVVVALRCLVLEVRVVTEVGQQLEAQVIMPVGMELAEGEVVLDQQQVVSEVMEALGLYWSNGFQIKEMTCSMTR